MGRLGPESAVVPPVGGVFAAFKRQNPFAAEPHFAGEVSINNSRFVSVASRPRWHEPDVIGVGWQDIAWSEIFRLDSITIRRPLGRNNRFGTRQNDDVVDCETAFELRKADFPKPARISGARTLERFRFEPAAKIARRSVLSKLDRIDRIGQGGACDLNAAGDCEILTHEIAFQLEEYVLGGFCM
jgi:hypothetical protein